MNRSITPIDLTVFRESEDMAVSRGDLHICGLRPDGKIACWGDYTNGQSTPPAL